MRWRLSAGIAAAGFAALGACDGSDAERSTFESEDATAHAPADTPPIASPDAASEAPEAGTPAPARPTPETHDWSVPCGGARRFTFEEADTVHFRSACPGTVRAETLPTGATYDPATRTVTWVPPLDRAGPFGFAFVDAEGVRTDVTGFVLDRFDAPGNAPVVDPLAYVEEHGLPVVHLHWTSADPAYCRDDAVRDPVPAEILVHGRAHVGAELRCRGASSLKLPKKSFSLRFSKESPFHAPPGLERFEGKRRLVLTQTFDDNSQIRTRMAFELHRRLDPAHLYVDQASVVVFVDGRYHGLYQLTDNVGSHFIEGRGLDEEGQLFKSEQHAADYRSVTSTGTPKPVVEFSYSKEEGEPAGDFSHLVALLQWVSTSSDATFEAEFDTVLRGDDFLDWYVFATAIIASDSYAKNSYVYLDANGPDARWRYVPWDLNASWGQDWTSARVPATEGAFPAAPRILNGIFERIVTIPALRARLLARYRAALDGPMSRENVLSIMEAMQHEVRLSAYRDDRRWDSARRTWPLWSSRTDFTTFDGEMVYLRNWIEARWTVLEDAYAE